MHHPDDDTRRALARCEEAWLREPAWRTGENGCEACGAGWPELPADIYICAACATAQEGVDDDFRATPYATSPLPADDDDVIPF